MDKLWRDIKRKISAILIFSMLMTNVVYLIPTNANGINASLIPECEVQEEYIDEGMFYMPYSSFEIDENDEVGKRIFKVKRKGNLDTNEKVKLR